MSKIIFILFLMMGFITYSQATATARVSATIIRVEDTTAYFAQLKKEMLLSKTIAVIPVVKKEVPKIFVTEKDSIRLMKRYIRKKKKNKWEI